ncbi:MAG: YqiA/YcfP family alpha/beta fold hydrolase [Candidatus Thalassarchaeaceae archaeon]
MLFAHGFEGSPTGSKPTFMKEALGWKVTAPKMSELGWSIASQTDVLVKHLDEEEYDLVVGSSMGGLAAANASSMRPHKDIRLLLIAPAFGLAENWEEMEETGRSAWKETGERRYTGYELDIVLPWEFMESAEKMSWPTPAHPTAIMHGRFDEVVPISYSRKVEESCKNVTLYETNDGHRMKDSLSLIQEIVSELTDGFVSNPNEGEKIEVQRELSQEVSDAGEVPDLEIDGDSEEDIERLEAEMKKLEEQMAEKKEKLEASKKEARIEELAQEKEEEEIERELQSMEASEAVQKAEKEVERARAEAEEATKKAEVEEAEAEEARLIAEMEEEEAQEAKAEAAAAKRKLADAILKAEIAGKDVKGITSEAENEKRELLILERVGKRRESIDWKKIGDFVGSSYDDLTLINGIDEFTQKKLNSLGVFSYEQLSRMDSTIAKEVNDALEMLPGKVIEMDWTKQAITMLELKGVEKASSSIIEDEGDEIFADLSAAQIKWAQIGKAGDRKSDDLTQIKGVDAETQKKLKVLGIRTYEQLSRMDSETAEAVDGALGLMPGRVSKMMWAQQAKALMD